MMKFLAISTIDFFLLGFSRINGKKLPFYVYPVAMTTNFLEKVKNTDHFSQLEGLLFSKDFFSLISCLTIHFFNEIYTSCLSFFQQNLTEPGRFASLEIK